MHRDLHLLILLILCLLVIPACSGQSGASVSQGSSVVKSKKAIFGVTNTNNWIIDDEKRKNLYDYPNDGVSNYSIWQDLQPDKNSYDWSGFDRLYKEAVSAKKKLSFSILAGTHVPSWVYMDVEQDPYKYQADQIQVMTFLPWQGQKGSMTLNTDVLEIWEETITQFSKKINNLPDKSVISYIAITGGPTSNGLEIMWHQDDFSEFLGLGWDTEKESLFIEYWKKLVDIFVEKFDVPLGLAFTDRFGLESDNTVRRDYKIPEIIISYAIQAAKKKGKTIIPMMLWVGKLEPPFDSHPAIELLKKTSVPFAIQGEMGTRTPQQLQAILQFAQGNPVLWVELWHHDFLNAEYADIINEHWRYAAWK